MQPLDRIERLVLAGLVIVAACVLVGLNRVDATTGLGIIAGAAGLALTGTVVGNALTSTSDATGDQGSQTPSPTTVPVISAVLDQQGNKIPLGGPGNPGV